MSMLQAMKLYKKYAKVIKKNPGMSQDQLLKMLQEGEGLDQSIIDEAKKKAKDKMK